MHVYIHPLLKLVYMMEVHFFEFEGESLHCGDF